MSAPADPVAVLARVYAEPHVPRRDEGEVACARELCGDGYTVHAVDGDLGGCSVCMCPGFLWVPPAGPPPEDRAP